MSFLEGKSQMTNVTPIAPASDVRKPIVIGILQDHEFFLHCDPHYKEHKTLPQPSPVPDAAAAKELYKLPEGIEPQGAPAVTLYEVVDEVPNPVWSSNVVSKEEFVNIPDGLWVRIHSPMGIVMETTWTVREKADGELELVEDVIISCSKLLMTIVKGQVDGNWRGIHKKIIDRVMDESKK